MNKQQINLISLSGRIGGGKDTVGRMIQELTTTQKVIPGYGNFDGNHFKPMTKTVESKWQIKKFAYKLKQVASILTGIPVEKFEDQEFKKQTIGELMDEGVLPKDFV